MTLFMEVSEMKMKKRNYPLIRTISFLLILVTLLSFWNKIFALKYFTRVSTWPTTSTINQFYKMEKNSVDVLFLGSSVVVNAFIPQEIYEDYGIRSYNLGSEQQSPFLSYYLLKEAYKSQNPKAVVLDLKFMQRLHSEAINTTERLARKTVDPMHWSANKVELIHTICNMDQSQSEISYYLTNIRFHSRWNDLKDYDFDSSQLEQSSMKGFGAIPDLNMVANAGHEGGYGDELTDPDPLMLEYLDKISQLCQENGSELILINLPQSDLTDGSHNYNKNYADAHQLKYYDLSEKERFEEILNSKVSECDASEPETVFISDHNNLWGAEKISSYMGHLLEDDCGILPVRDVQWENTKGDYQELRRASGLVLDGDFPTWSKQVCQDDNILLVSSYGSAAVFVQNEDYRRILENLGVTKFDEMQRGMAYVGLLSKGEAIREMSIENEAGITGKIDQGHLLYQLKSQSGAGGNGASILLNAEENGVAGEGLNIVVYDTKQMKVIDSIAINPANGMGLQR